MRTHPTLRALSLSCLACLVSACAVQPTTRKSDPASSESKTSGATTQPTAYVNSTKMFSIKLPPGYDHLEESSDMELSPKGNILVSAYSWPGDSKGAGVCGVVVYSLSEELINSKKPEEILDGVLRTRSKGATEQKRSFTLQSFPAVSYRTSFTDEKGSAYARELFAYALGNVYRVNFVTEKASDLDAPGIENFFTSFHIDRMTAEERLRHLDQVRQKAAEDTRKELDEIAKRNDGQGSSSNGVVDGGKLNARAIELPKPAYPPVARAAKASGDVVVEVMVNERGEVISANVISGPPLLRATSAAAARQARFGPETRDGKPVKVKGTLVFNFQ